MKLKSGIASVMLFIIVVVSSCSKSSTKEDIPLPAVEDLNVSYGNHHFNTLDLYLPANRTADTKTIILLHGGFWAQGDKQELTNYAKLFQSQGFAVANINYRLTNTSENNIHPAQVLDIQKAIDFISLNAGEWKVSSDQMALIGASSGAHLALLYTFAYNADNKVKTVVSIAGPTNLTDPRNISTIQQQAVGLLIGSAFEDNPSAYAQASPITHIKASSKPTLLIHGKKDMIVPYHQAEDCKAKLDQFNVENKLVQFEDLGHDDIINQQNSTIVLLEIINWINSTID